MILPGFPITTACAGTSLVTTAPAPIMAHSPIVIPQTIVAFAPIEAPYFTMVSEQTQSSEVFNSPSSVIDQGHLSLVKATPGPMNTPSSIVTPCGIMTLS